MKVNIGAGKYRPDGWFNCDIQEHRKAPKPLDARCDARKIPLSDGCADVVQAIHIWEHFYRWECEEVIAEWSRLLKPGGVLILELPDLMKFCKNILEGTMLGGKHPDQLGMWGAWGDPRTKDPYMVHRWGWSPESIEEFLNENGFASVKQAPTQFHPAGREHRDMRIEAVKK